MAQSVDTVVNEFLRDAQYRVAELSRDIDTSKRSNKRRRNDNVKERDWRAQLL